MSGDADGACLIRDRAAYRLADPPGCGSRTYSRGGSRIYRPLSSDQYFLPGSGRGTAGRDRYIRPYSRPRATSANRGFRRPGSLNVTARPAIEIDRVLLK